MTGSILIVGTGALATLFAARLSAASTQVAILGTWKAGLEALNRNGARLDDLAGMPVRATDCPSDLKNVKYALVLVKSWQTERAARQLEQCLAEDGLAVTLQNGLGNDEILAGVLGEDRVGRGITTIGATLLEPGYVRLGGEGKVILEECPLMGRLEELLRMSHIETETHMDIRSQVWGKLVINAAINPLTALLRVRNAGLLEIPSARILIKEVSEEAAGVAASIGTELPYPDPAEAVESAARSSGDNLSSMLQDVLRGSRSEVEAINGSIVQVARSQNLPAPYNQAMEYLINSLSERGKIKDFSSGNGKEV